jgi:heterodisulfide reductase subunit B
VEVKEFTRELRRLGVSMNQIAARANSLGFVDDLEYRRNADEVMKVLGAIQQEYAKKGVKLIGNH